MLWRVSDPASRPSVSRLRRFAHALGSAYGVLAATALFTLGAVPLALNYLSREEFGLWALMTQIGGYLMLVDLGMSSSVSRLLIDYKDRPDDGDYGSLIRTGWLVSCVQGVLVLLAGPLLAGPMADAMAIAPELREEFIALVNWQCVIIGAGFVTKPIHLVLYAHQRIDLTNYAQIAGWAVNFAVMWAAFGAGWSVYSLVWGGAAAWLVNQGVGVFAVLRLRLLPRAGCWGRPSRARFHEVFSFGKDIFLIVLGTQLVDASQVIVITRALGLEAAALWAVGTKAFQFLAQVQARLFALSAPVFAEMMVRGERDRLLRRFRSLAMAAAAFAGFGGVGILLCNSAFVALWTQGKMTWPFWNDLLLALCLVAQAMKNFHAGFAPLTKRIGALKYIYLVEGIAFVVLGLAVTPHGGLPALIAVGTGCTATFTVAYGIRRTCEYFDLSPREVWLGWLAPASSMLARLAPVALVALALLQTQPPIVRLFLGVLVGGGAGGWGLVRFGLPETLRQELTERLPEPFNGFFRRVCQTGA